MVCKKYVGLALQPYVLQFYTAKLVIFSEYVKLLGITEKTLFNLRNKYGIERNGENQP